MKHPAVAALMGVARADITPAVGIYNRNWGAAVHDAAEGIHRPLAMTVLTLQESAGAQPLVLIDTDLGWWASIEYEAKFRARLQAALDVPVERLIFAVSHTHAAPPLSEPEPGWHGGEHLVPFVEHIFSSAVETTKRALTAAEPATLEWHTGRCSLAANRDLPEPDGTRVVCGYNPEITADDTLLVGRVTSASGRLMATLANYACHPTTLAWENRLVSPDYVGAMRETVERNTGEAPALFMQGASGELAPRYQYVGDPAVADAHGRELGYAVLATLEAMEPAGHALVYAGVVESGAPLATWKRQPVAASTTLRAARRVLDVPLKDWPSAAELDRQYRASPDRTLAERIRRKLRIREAIGDGATFPLEVWAWRIGDALLLGAAVEAYSWLQQRLRAEFPARAVAWVNLVNGSVGYVPTAPLYDSEIYQVWQTPFARGSLELLEAGAVGLARELLEESWEPGGVP